MEKQSPEVYHQKHSAQPHVLAQIGKQLSEQSISCKCVDYKLIHFK